MRHWHARIVNSPEDVTRAVCLEGIDHNISQVRRTSLAGPINNLRDPPSFGEWGDDEHSIVGHQNISQHARAHTAQMSLKSANHNVWARRCFARLVFCLALQNLGKDHCIVNALCVVNIVDSQKFLFDGREQILQFDFINKS